MKEKPVRKTKEANYGLQPVRTDSRCMWMWILYRNQSIELQNKSIEWFLNDKNLRDERVNALLLAYIH